MAFIKVIHIGAPKGLHDLGAPDPKDDILGDTGFLVGIV